MSRPHQPTGVQVTYCQQYRRCSKADYARCAPGQPGHGPYWYSITLETDDGGATAILSAQRAVSG